ncbi:uncharacterized protein [Parasteatoda tepidariorum]|uniref:uncharacterized protein n=1 Tax=Parasteatoda tepidariorum TaxID=114398 RepID=UPI0039BD3EC2
MANMKRKADHSENNRGSFHQSSIPSYMFILVEDVLISTTIYRDRILVNVRRYKKHGEKYYPSKEEITLTPYQFFHLVNSSFLREKSTEKKKDHPLYEYFINLPYLIDSVTVYSDASVSIQDKDKFQNIVCIEFGETILLKKASTCRSGNTYTTSITLNDEQWDKIFSIQEFMLDNYIILNIVIWILKRCLKRC